MKQKDENKAVRLYVVIAVIVLCITVVSTVLAYFSMSTNQSREAKFKANFGDAGGVSLSTPTPTIFIKLTNEDMNILNEGKSYYATDNVGKKYETERVDYTAIKIQTLSSSSNNSYDCNLEFGINVSGEIKEALTNGDATLYLSGDYTAEFDLKDNISNINVNYTLNDDNNIKEIKTALKFNNKVSSQNDLAGKDLSLTMNVINFLCNASN